MSGRQDHRDWAIARVLFTDHLLVLVFGWGIFAGIAVALTIGIATFGTVRASVWDQAAWFLRWPALGYGLHLVNKVLPACVGYGRTRREFMSQTAMFLVGAPAVIALLMALGYGVEALVYGAAGWPQELSQGQRLFAGPGQVGPVVLTYLVELAVWMTAGTLLAAGFSREGWSGLLAILGALLLVILAGVSVGSGLPPLDRLLGIEVADVPLGTTVALSAGTFLLGVACTWALVRDIPVRTRPG